ncbi:MAG: aspartate/glutamate racemase family protein [Hyphomicrobiales bacterium]|nr:aspartate/glutamate racemase family protein [Hyphomicrobiales bacterium]
MHIGLIGGIGPAATDFYYRRLMSTFAARNAKRDLTIVHADTPTLLGNLGANNVAEQVAIYSRLTARLFAAGADCVVVTSVAGHFCIGPFKAVSPLPVVDMIEEVAAAIDQRSFRRIGILGTQTVMETCFYGGIARAELMPPHGQALDDMHQAYAAMAAAGVVTQAQRDVVNRAIEIMLTGDGAEAILLGGTDLALAFHQDSVPFPLIDCAAIHVDAVVRMALS